MVRGDIHIADIVHGLERHDLLPTIVFRTSRNQCDVDAERASRKRSLALPAPKQRELRETIQDVIRQYDMDADLIKTHPQYNGLVKTGIGAHHAGQLLMWRLLLEELMTRGCLRVLLATGTVAAGVDFPARTVVITAHTRRGAEGFQPLSAAEFQQMSGRAGRRGRDTVGFCVAAPTPFCDARALLRISKRPPEPLKSAYFPGPSTVLNLLRYRNVDDLRYTVERSLASFNDRSDSEKLIEEVQTLAAKLPQAVLREEPTPEMTTEELLELLQNPVPGEALDKDCKRQLKRMRRSCRLAQDLLTKQSGLLDRSLHGLTELGYVEGANLSEKGYWSANLCTSLVLELAEIIESEMLLDPSLERLVAVVASISGDPHRKYLQAKQPAIDEDDQEKIAEIITRVQKYEMPGVSETREVVPAAAHTAVTWLYADSWQEFRSLLFLSGVAEGDAARLITQTAEHLNQLARLSESHPQLASVAIDAKRRVLRPPLTEAINVDALS